MSDSILSESELAALSEIAEQFEHSRENPSDYGVFDFTAREAGVLRQMSLLPGTHQRHAEQLGFVLAQAFGLRFSITAETPRIATYADLLMSLEEEAALLSFQMSPLRGGCYLTCPAELLSILVNRYFGGSTGAGQSGRRRKVLSPGEQRMAELLGKRVLEAMQEAWSDRLNLQPEALEAQPNTDKLAAEPTENQVLVLQLNVATGDDWSGSLQLVIPFSAIEPFKQRLAKSTKPATEGPSAWGEALEARLPSLLLGVSVELSQLELSLAETLALRVGHVLPLKMPDTVRVRLEDLPIAEGEYGSSNGLKAVKITTIQGTSTSDAP